LADDLISFDRPPVVEVALAVQFEPNTVSALQAALFRKRVLADLPEYQEQIARPPIEEDFSPPGLRPPISFELLTAPPSPRYWLLSRDGARLVQLQHDLMAANWRRLPSGESYPKYPALRSVLRDRLGDLNAILVEEGQTPIKPDWCEVTYVNHVAPLGSEVDPPSPQRVLKWFTVVGEGFLPHPEDAQLNMRFLMTDDAEKPRGRLHVSLASAFRAEDRVPIWTLTLTARVRSDEPSIDGALSALDDGRAWADRAFEEITTAEMHDVWGLERKERNELSR
jgi:uncharacterized protein (TIGR04255 family)